MKKKLHRINFHQLGIPRAEYPQTPNEGQIFSHIEKKKQIHEAFDFLELIKVWPDIVGPVIAKHTIPLKNIHQTLVILSNHSAFASELSFMEVPLKNKIFKKFPVLQSSIKKIQFQVDSHFFESKVAIEQSIFERKKIQKFVLPSPHSPLYKKLKKETDELFKHIEDEEMKSALTSLYFQSNS